MNDSNTSSNGAVTVIDQQRKSLVVKVAERFNVEPQRMLATLKATAFKTSKEVSNEQMMALLIVSDQYQLNPFTRELFAFPDERGGITPVVSIDGWDRIINSNPVVEDGPNFRESDEQVEHEGKKVPAWIECTIKRRDRLSPTVIRERFKECVRGTGPWKSHPARMLRHKAMIQAARIALGYSGIYDLDEAQRIAEAQAIDASGAASLPPALAALNAPPAPPAPGVQQVIEQAAAPLGPPLTDPSEASNVAPGVDPFLAEMAAAEARGGAVDDPAS